MEDESLPAHEKTVERLTDEATILVIAASETPAKVLSLIIFYLLARPDMIQLIREELRTISAQDGGTPSLHQLEQLPHLSATVKEGLRLHGGIVTRSQRVSRNEALQYGDYIIPAGTSMSTSSYFVHRNPTLFPGPSEFVPERWLKSDGTRAQDRYLVAFGKGTRNCVGQNLGQAELYMTLAAVLKNFDLELFRTDVTDVEIERDWYVMQPKRDSQGVRVMVKESN